MSRSACAGARGPVLHPRVHAWRRRASRSTHAKAGARPREDRLRPGAAAAPPARSADARPARGYGAARPPGKGACGRRRAACRNGFRRQADIQPISSCPSREDAPTCHGTRVARASRIASPARRARRAPRPAGRERVLGPSTERGSSSTPRTFIFAFAAPRRDRTRHEGPKVTATAMIGRPRSGARRPTGAAGAAAPAGAWAA